MLLLLIYLEMINYLPACAIWSMHTVTARINASFWPGSMDTP